MTAKRLSLSALALLVAVSLAQHPAGTTAADPPKGGTFRIMSPDELDYVDPALGY